MNQPSSTSKTAQERELIELITREVMLQLAARQAGNGTTAVERADARIQPPLGTCTGDYSKFPELAARLNPPKVLSQNASDNAAAMQPSAQSPLTGFVTENQLREAIKSSTSGVALLAADAKLTPLGNDFARQFPQKIRRTLANAARSGDIAKSNTPAGDLPWQWWIQGQCPVVAAVTSERTARLRKMSAGNNQDNLVRVVRELALAIKSGTVAGGLLFVPSAARAMCLANRCQSIRAVVGTCGEAVEQGVRELGANVLVIEYPHHGPRAAAAMVERMMSQLPVVPASVQRDLADLHRCG